MREKNLHKLVKISGETKCAVSNAKLSFQGLQAPLTHWVHRPEPSRPCRDPWVMIHGDVAYLDLYIFSGSFRVHFCSPVMDNWMNLDGVASHWHTAKAKILFNRRKKISAFEYIHEQFARATACQAINFTVTFSTDTEKCTDIEYLYCCYCFVHLQLKMLGYF